MLLNLIIYLNLTKLKKRREYCVSCCLPFCSLCCFREILLPQIGEDDPVRVCDICFQRQDFINFLDIFKTYGMRINSKSPNMSWLEIGNNYSCFEKSHFDTIVFSFKRSND